MLLNVNAYRQEYNNSLKSRGSKSPKASACNPKFIMSPTRLLCQEPASDMDDTPPGSRPEPEVHVNLHDMHRDPLTSPSTEKKPPPKRNWKLKCDLDHVEPADSDVKRKLFHDPEGGESEEEKESDPLVDKAKNKEDENEEDKNEEDENEEDESQEDESQEDENQEDENEEDKNKREASKGTLKD